MLNEWWTVHGAANGTREFHTEEEAEEFYNKIKYDSWSSLPSLVHHKVIDRVDHE